MKFHEVLRKRRTELGLSQETVAAVVGVNKRQIRRYEAGEAQPVLSVAVALANALRISLSELVGITAEPFDLSGPWWAAWQSYKDGVDAVALQEVNFHHHGDLIQVYALSRGIDVEDGGYLWSGELRLWDREVLMGWYGATDGATRAKGTMYFVLHRHGQHMSGRWVGMSYDSAIETGWGCIARTEEDAKCLIDRLRTNPGQPLP